jgi:hypothetical protein
MTEEMMPEETDEPEEATEAEYEPVPDAAPPARLPTETTTEVEILPPAPRPGDLELARQQAGSMALVDRPVESQVIEVPLDLERHYWPVKVSRQLDHYEMSRTGLVTLCGAAGVSVRSWLITLRSGYCHAAAEGECLWPSGYLERFTRTKEYDAGREMEKAMLKEMQYDHADELKKLPFNADPKTVLDALDMAKLKQAQLEVLTHLEAHCRSRAEDQVMRYFLHKMGAPLRLTLQDAAQPIVARLMRSRETFEGQLPDSGLEPLYDDARPSVPPPVAAGGTGQGPSEEAPGQSSGTAGPARGRPPKRPTTSQDTAAPETPAPSPAPDGSEQCDECGRALTAREIEWCQSHSAKFSDHLLCYNCQKGFEKE